MTKNMKIGFIGTGVMGKSMVSNLIKAGYQVSVYTRTKTKADELIQQGANWVNSVAELSRKTDLVITMVGYPSDVEEVYFGANGILENTKEGTYLVDMTTSKPSLAEEIYKQAKHKNLLALDAPVSGGDIGAKNGSLAIMVGCEQDVFNKLLHIFQVLGENIVLQGAAGAGQHTKMANQITIASNMIGVSEAIMYAKKAGLDPSQVLDSITTGAAGSWSLSNLAPRMIQGDDSPGFYIKQDRKSTRLNSSHVAISYAVF